MVRRGQNNSKEKNRILPQVLGMARRARIIPMECQFSVTCEKIKEIATNIVDMKDFLKCVILWNCFKNDTVPSWVKKTVSKFLESEIMSSEEASGMSTVLLMDPGLVFWNSFKTVTVPSWVQKKTVSKFLESEIMSSEEASGTSTVLLMDPGLVFWNSFKTVTFPSWVHSKFNTFFWDFKNHASLIL